MSKELSLKLWGVLEDVSKLPKLSLDVTLDPIIKDLSVIRTQFSVDKKPLVPHDILTTAKYIMSLEPSFKNTRGDVVHLAQARAQLDISEEQIVFVINKIKPVVKDYIMVTKGDQSISDKLRINSKHSKSELIDLAVRHLLTGNLVTDNKDVFTNVKVASYLKRGLLPEYVALANFAYALQLNSVHEMMELFVLPFIDQRNNLESTGLFTFYDGHANTLPLGG